MDAHGRVAGRPNKHHHRSSSSSAFFSKAAENLEAAVAGTMWRWWPVLRGCATTRRALLTVGVAAALLAAAVIVLNAGEGGPNGMPDSLFFPADAQGVEDIPPWNLTAAHLLDGLLTPEFSHRSCRSRYEFAHYYKKSPHKPSPYLIAKLRKQEALQRRCGPGTAAHEKALRRLESSGGDDDLDGNDGDDCRYLVYISYRGLSNRMLAIASAFLYAVLTDRVLLVDGGKDVADLFCEPFPGATWLLPPPSSAGGWWWSSWWSPSSSSSPLNRLQSFDQDSKESLGNMLQSGATVSDETGNVTWSSEEKNTPPAYVYLHLAGGYGYHDKLFFCGAHQRLLLRDVPWLLMRTDNYIVPGLFLIPTFRAELEAMFPDKDAVFYLLGRYLFHPSNAVWHAVTAYHRAHLAGAADRVVGVQIRVFHKKQPRQLVLDQALSCLRNEKLIIPAETETINIAGNATSSPSSSSKKKKNKVVVLVTSLSSWYSERMREELGSEVRQPSHEGRQRWRDAAHDRRALSEMLLLGTCDALVTSGFSTFGYVAQGLAGLRPWVMHRSPMWAHDWREDGLGPDEPPCRRVASVEPCFHSPSAYDCDAGRDVELDGAAPYVRRCVDVSWGIKLVNQSSSSSQ
ncbi:hypothetical protein PR202_gb06856 [Eleusine coracana subsp. coracana]|uniref:Fucosyltransferase n=1 Tax=Eleusine coracana subsp. coracana TaxID=191504 RepID=A0AAV5EAI2_ELECO|nr:hypothetical protein PR202_gb06856 [Eleusine coracana subsp. coracana]